MLPLINSLKIGRCNTPATPCFNPAVFSRMFPYQLLFQRIPCVQVIIINVVCSNAVGLNRCIKFNFFPFQKIYCFFYSKISHIGRSLCRCLNHSSIFDCMLSNRRSIFSKNINLTCFSGIFYRLYCSQCRSVINAINNINIIMSLKCCLLYTSRCV